MSQLEYVSMAPAVDIAPIAGGIVGGMVLMIMICVILFLLFLKIVHHLCSHQRLVQLSSGRDDEIEMTDNILYQSSAGVSGESTEVVDHTYEKIYCDFEENTKTKDNDDEKIGHDHVNENLYPKEVNEQVMDETKIIDQEDDENIDLSTKHDKKDKIKNTAGQTTVDTVCKNSAEIYD